VRRLLRQQMIQLHEPHLHDDARRGILLSKIPSLQALHLAGPLFGHAGDGMWQLSMGVFPVALNGAVPRWRLTVGPTRRDVLRAAHDDQLTLVQPMHLAVTIAGATEGNVVPTFRAPHRRGRRTKNDPRPHSSAVQDHQARDAGRCRRGGSSRT
jgi:hypothetical protein